jgi:hypothetical protein
MPTMTTPKKLGKKPAAETLEQRESDERGSGRP